jgi:hypothetical protein
MKFYDWLSFLDFRQCNVCEREYIGMVRFISNVRDYIFVLNFIYVIKVSHIVKNNGTAIKFNKIIAV